MSQVLLYVMLSSQRGAWGEREGEHFIRRKED
jgi:hypothetical protein